MDEVVIERRLLAVAIFLTNGNILVETKYEKAAETRLQELTGMCYHCVFGKGCLCSGRAKFRLPPHLCFRSSLASIRAVTYAWNLQRV